MLFFKRKKRKENIVVVEKENNDIKDINEKEIEKIDSHREKYRISLKDAEYFLIAYGILLTVTIVLLVLNFDFVHRWSIVFAFLFILPYGILALKEWYITKKRRKEYFKIIKEESSLPLYKKIFIFYKNNASKDMLSNYELIEQVFLDTKFAFNKIHEIKMYAIKKKADAIIDLQFNSKGIAIFYLAKKKNNER